MFVCEGETVRDGEQPVVVMEGAVRLMGVVLRAIVSLHRLSGHIVYAWGHMQWAQTLTAYSQRHCEAICVCTSACVQHMKVAVVVQVCARVFVFICACEGSCCHRYSPPDRALSSGLWHASTLPVMLFTFTLFPSALREPVHKLLYTRSLLHMYVVVCSRVFLRV